MQDKIRRYHDDGERRYAYRLVAPQGYTYRATYVVAPVRWSRCILIHSTLLFRGRLSFTPPRTRRR